MYLNSENDPDGLRYMARLLDVLRRERELKGWTPRALAGLAKVHNSIIHRAETGERFPSVPVLVRLCRALGMEFSELCARAEEIEPKE